MRRFTLIATPSAAMVIAFLSSEPCLQFLHAVLVLFMLVTVGVGLLNLVGYAWLDFRGAKSVRSILAAPIALIVAVVLVWLTAVHVPLRLRFLASHNAFENLRLGEAASPGPARFTNHRRVFGKPVERRVGLFYVVDAWEDGDSLRVRCCEGTWGAPNGFTFTTEGDHPSHWQIHMTDDWYWWSGIK